MTMKEKSREHRKKFLEVFKRLTSTRHPRTVFNDFVTMSACAISNACDKSQFARREDLYMNIVKGYSHNELESMCELFALTALALEADREQDFLGKLFMELNLGNVRTGQFLTPYNVSYMMAKLSGIPEEIGENTIISTGDCCCGTGGMLIAHANVMLEHGINYQRHVLYYAQDIDPCMAHATYIQLALLGCMAQVAVGDTISNPLPAREDVWLTPLYCLNYHLLIGEKANARQENDVQPLPISLPHLFPSGSPFGFYLLNGSE